jgi:hypothetical protein
MTQARNLIYEGHSFLLQFFQCLIDVFDLKTDMIYAGLAFIAHASKFAIRLDSCEQFDHRVTDVIERELVGPPRRMLETGQWDAKAILPEASARRKVSDHDANMLDTLDFHHPSFRRFYRDHACFSVTMVVSPLSHVRRYKSMETVRYNVRCAE